jgi:hypothetical protein
MLFAEDSSEFVYEQLAALRGLHCAAARPDSLGSCSMDYSPNTGNIAGLQRVVFRA